MILRLTAAGAVLVGLGGTAFFLGWIGAAPWSGGEERHLRAMKQRTAVPAAYAPMTFADFAALPHGRPRPAFAALEQRAVSLEGHVRMISRSMDGDMHLTLVPAPHPDTIRHSPGVSAEITPEFHRGSPAWRFEALEARFRTPWSPAPWPAPAARVRISGWLLYDFQYDEPHYSTRRPIGARGPGTRLTGWEIHPVTRIEFWDDTLAAYVELPR